MNYQEVFDFVLGTQLSDGAFPLRQGEPADILTTAQLVSLLYYMDLAANYQPQIEAACRYLKAQQKPNGKWTTGVNSWETGITAWAICALLKSGMTIADEPISRAWIWLMHRQKENGAFVQSETVFRVNLYCHAYAIRTLALLENSYQSAKKQAVAYLLDAQNGDGGFSLYPGEASTPQMTGYIMHGISRYHSLLQDNLGQKGLRYLLDNQNADGSWGAPSSNTWIESTAFGLFILRLTKFNGMSIDRGFEFMDYQLKHSRWDLLPVSQLVSMIQANFVRY